jgi:hypothetical protein
MLLVGGGGITMSAGARITILYVTCSFTMRIILCFERPYSGLLISNEPFGSAYTSIRMRVCLVLQLSIFVWRLVSK